MAVNQVETICLIRSFRTVDRVGMKQFAFWHILIAEALNDACVIRDKRFSHHFAQRGLFNIQVDGPTNTFLFYP